MTFDTGSTVGLEYVEDSSEPVFGADPRVRSGTIIYNDVIAGESFQTGHYAVVREFTEVGDNVLVGTQTVIDGRTTLGSNVSLQTGVYIPSHTTMGDNVFVGPNATLTNDPVPVRQEVDLEGPTLQDGVSVGANATVLPGITIGENSFVAAGAVVTKDVPADTLAIGAPARFQPLPDDLSSANDI